MKAIQILKKLRDLKITILFEEKSLNPQTIKEIDEALEEFEAIQKKMKYMESYADYLETVISNSKGGSSPDELKKHLGVMKTFIFNCDECGAEQCK